MQEVTVHLVMSHRPSVADIEIKVLAATGRDATDSALAVARRYGAVAYRVF